MKLWQWLERLSWLLFHRHNWVTIRINESLDEPIIRQGCRLNGCSARRTVYDDGRPVARQLARELERHPEEWRDPPNPNKSRLPLPGTVYAAKAKADNVAPASRRSIAIHRLDRAVSRIGRLARDLPEEDDAPEEKWNL